MGRVLFAIAAMILVGCGSQGTAHAQVVVTGPGGQDQASWLGGNAVQTQVVVGADGETYVGVWIDAPEQVAVSAHRAPMAVSLVVDTSGSMSGGKIQNARMAAASLLETLSDGDIVSIYSFASTVMELAPPTVVGPGTRRALMQRVQGLVAGGGTNMWGGVTAGVARMSQAPPTHAVRRVVVISDGQANIGPSDPASLGNLVARGTESGMQVTAIGVGLDYDETTLGVLAVRSSGRMYHLEHPGQMANILRQEVQLLASTIATDAYIEIVPAPGVIIVDGVSMGATVQDGKLRVPIGSVYSGQRRNVLFRAQLPTGRVGDRALATARLVYRGASANAAEVTQTHQLNYNVTRSARAATASRDGRVAGMVATHEASRAQLRAAEMLNRGDNVAAAVALDEAEVQLRSAAAAAPASPARREMMQQAEQMRSGSSRARRSTSRQESRAAALDSFDSAYEASGF